METSDTQVLVVCIRNVPYKLWYVNIWFPVAGAVYRGYGAFRSLAGEVHHCEWTKSLLLMVLCLRNKK